MGLQPTVSLSALSPRPLASASPTLPFSRQTPVVSPTNNATTPPPGTPYYLMDPITRKDRDIPSPFDEELLHLNAWQKTKLNLHNTFVDIPKQIYHGLRGDNQYSYSNFLNLSRIPYYLGGAVLAASFAAGGDRVNFLRQGLGVLLYFAGMGVSNSGINALYKASTGIDLDMRFRKPNGDIEKVFGSSDFPRIDLFKDKDFVEPLRKMEIPLDVADPKQEIREAAREIVSDSRADKTLWGTLLAAFGAAAIARSLPLAGLVEGRRQFRADWHHPNNANAPKLSLLEKLQQSWYSAKAFAKPTLQDKLNLLATPTETHPMQRFALVGAVLTLSGLIITHALRSRTSGHRNYESPFIDRLSPSLYPEDSPAATPPSLITNSPESANSAETMQTGETAFDELPPTKGMEAGSPANPFQPSGNTSPSASPIATMPPGGPPSNDIRPESSPIPKDIPGTLGTLIRRGAFQNFEQAQASTGIFKPGGLIQ